MLQSANFFRVDSLGFPPPTPIHITGLPADVANVLKFDLLFMGFTNVPPDQAKYIVNGTTSPGIGARVVERVNRNEVLAKAFTGGTPRMQIHSLADAGNEIGGHTLHHVNLTTVNLTTAQTEVCNDRQALLAQGFSPVASFVPSYGSPRRLS